MAAGDSIGAAFLGGKFRDPRGVRAAGRRKSMELCAFSPQARFGRTRLMTRRRWMTTKCASNAGTQRVGTPRAIVGNADHPCLPVSSLSAGGGIQATNDVGGFPPSMRHDRLSDTAQGWADLDRRELIYACVVFGFVPALLFAMLAATALFGDVPSWFGWAGGAGGMAVFFGASAYLQGFRCPRCGERFFAPSRNTSKACAHCNLRRGTASPSS